MVIPAFNAAKTLEQTVRDMARGQYWIHPALSEVVEYALLKLELADVEDLTTYQLTP